MPGVRPGMSSLGACDVCNLLEVIARADVGRAFDRRSRSDRREQRGVMIGAELVIPVSITDVGVPNSLLTPEHLRRIKGEANVLKHFRLSLVVVERAGRAEAADRYAVYGRN